MPVRSLIALNLLASAAAWSGAVWLGLHRWETFDAGEILHDGAGRALMLLVGLLMPA